MLYVVDDAADYRFLIQHVFKLFLSKYPLRLFADGLELIQAIEQPAASLPVELGGSDVAQPDYAGSNLALPGLIVLDVDMPRLNGYQTLERLKQDPLWQTVPVVMMSNRVDPRFVDTAYQLDASAYIVKPMEITELKKVMERLCQQWLDA